MATLQDLRKKAGYKTIKSFAEAYGCGATKASGILRSLYHMTLTKEDVKRIASVLRISFVECADACDNTFAEFKGYKGDEWKKTPRTHKGIWARWQWEEEFFSAQIKDWRTYRESFITRSQQQHPAQKRMPQTITEAFQILSLSPSASTQQIKQSFRSKALQGEYKHPDVGGDEQLFKVLNAAYAIALKHVK